MEELDKAYEAAEMLRVLDLPISINQIEIIERLEDECGMAHREDLRYYFYDKCFATYTKRIMNIRQAKKRGEAIVAKPVLLVAIIDGIGLELYSNNKITLTERLEARYVKLMQQYMKNSQFDKLTDISNPFWHLESDGFWHLQYEGERLSKGCTPSKAWLKENVEYAYFDEPLWILLQNKVWRMKLRNYIIEHKLTDDFRKGKMAADGLAILTAILLAA